MTSDSPSVRPRWRWIVLAWTIPALIGAAQTSLAFSLRPTHGVRIMGLRPMAGSLFDSAQWMSWALVTPIIFAVVRRVPLRRGHLVRAVSIHIVAALLLGFVMRSVWFFVSIPVRLRYDMTHWTYPAIRMLYVPTVISGLL